MALCLVLEEKIVQCKKTIEHLQEKITKLKAPSNNIRILKHEISIQKEAVRQLNKQHELKDSGNGNISASGPRTIGEICLLTTSDRPSLNSVLYKVFSLMNSLCKCIDIQG
jgi:FtsZ-binding cell division protein ZapB